MGKIRLLTPQSELEEKDLSIYKFYYSKVSKQYILAIYAHIIFTAPCIMFLMRADTLREQVGEGWALKIKNFLGPVKWHRDDRRVPFGAQKA
jgi:hypothetical protein